MSTGRSRGACLAALLLGACTTGEGEGEVVSTKLFVEDCWDDAFDLGPTFFAASPYRDDVSLRVQRGDDFQEVSDGLLLQVSGIAAIRGGMLGQPIDAGLPKGVTPAGMPVVPDPSPALVSGALFLHDSCHVQNGVLYSVGGTVTFDSLFSGDINELEAGDRFTDASFSLSMADPRDVLPDRTYPPGRLSTVTGWFRFFFERGQPAQPFP